MDETFITLEAALRRIGELKDFIEAERRQHARELADEQERTRAAQFEAEIGRWAVKGMAGYQVRMMLPDFAQIDGKGALEVADHLGKRAAHELLHGSKTAFADWSEYHRALHHIHYLENHARNRGVEFTPFEQPMHDPTNRPIPKPWDWPTKQPPR